MERARPEQEGPVEGARLGDERCHRLVQLAGARRLARWRSQGDRRHRSGQQAPLGPVHALLTLA